MKYRTHSGRTGIEVSPYCLGAMMFGAMAAARCARSVRRPPGLRDRRAQWVAERRGLERFRTEQPPTRSSTGSIEREVLPICQRYGDGHAGLESAGPAHPARREGRPANDHLAMAFAIAHPGVTSAILGPRTMEQLDDLLAGADVTLDDEVLDRIDEIASTRYRCRPNDVAYTPPAISSVSLRRRAGHERSAA